MTRIVNVWTDGACTVNTRKGGWGVVLQCPSAASGEIITKELSGSDTALMNFVIHFISNSLQESTNYITVVDKLKDFDAAIATGSNSTAKHFEYYLKGKEI